MFKLIVNRSQDFFCPFCNCVGSSKVTVDPSPTSGLSRVLQGQEFSTLRGTFAESNESDTAEKSVVWPPLVDEEKINVVSTSRRFGSDNWMHLMGHEPTCTDLLSGFGAQTDSSHGLSSFNDQNDVAVNKMKKHLENNLLASPWSMMPSSLSFNLLESSIKMPMQGSDPPYQTRGDARFGGFSEYPSLHGYRIEQQQGNWLMPPPSQSQFEHFVHSRDIMEKPILDQKQDTMKPKDGNCKLFGIPLIGNPVTSEPAVSHRSMTEEPGAHLHLASIAFDSDQKSEQSKGPKSTNNHLAVGEPEKPCQTSLLSRDVQGKVQSVSTRSCTKVWTRFWFLKNEYTKFK